MKVTSETLWGMDTRQIAGTIVRDEIARKGYKRDKAATAMHMAKSTLERFIAGDDRVTDMTLRQIEGFFGFPRRLLDFVIEGDAARIASLTMIDEDLRQQILYELSDIHHQEPLQHEGRLD